MTLANLIQQYALSQATAGDWAGCAEILNDPTISVPNNHAWTFGELIDSQGIANMQLVAGTIQAAGAADAIMNSAFIALSTTGLRLDSPDRQALIDQLGVAGSWPQTLIDSIKQSGLQIEPPSPSVVTAQECEDAWNANVLQTKWATLQNEGLNLAIANGDKAAVKTILITFAGSL
jgi:hypothetical protein